MGGGGGTTVVSNTTTVVQPTPPSPSPVVTSGKVKGTPQPQTIGSTIIQSAPPETAAARQSASLPAWVTVPNIPILAPPAFPTQSATSSSFDARVKLQDAVHFQERTCNDITQERSAEAQQFSFTGNGGATRFRFNRRGAPSNVVVLNLTQDETIAPSNYSVDVRGDSFSWLVFDTAPADGDEIFVQYNVGDSGIIQSVPTISWNNWRNDLSDVERLLNRIQNNVEGSNTWNNRTTTVDWKIDDPTVIQDAMNATRNLRSSLGIPGSQLNVDSVRNQCNNLNKILADIDRRLNRKPSGQPEPAGSSVKHYEINVTNTDLPPRIYDNDIRFVYFSSDSARSGFFNYAPPNKQMGQTISLWTRRIDNLTRRVYYEKTGYRTV